MVLRAVFIVFLSFASAQAGAERLNLVQMIDRFVAESPSLQAARLEMEKARHRKKESFGSFFPTLDFVASRSVQEFPENPDLGVMGGLGAKRQVYSLGLEGQWALYAGGGRFNDLKMKKLEVELSERNYRGSINGDLAEVVKACLNWMAVRDELVSLRSGKKSQKRYLDITKKRQKRGAALAFELSQARADYLSYDPRIDLLEEQKLSEELKLQAALALESPPELKLDWPKVGVLPIPANDEAIKKAQSQRPDFKALEVAKKMAEAGKSLELTSDKPTVSLFGTYNFQNNRFKDMLDEDNKGMTYGLSLTWPIFSGLSSVHKRRAAQGEVEVAQKNLDVLKYSLASEINQAIAGYKRSQTRLNQGSAWLKAAREALRLGNESFKVGRVSSVQWVQLQKAKEAAEVNFVKSRLGYHMSVLQLGLALGEDLDIMYKKVVQ